MPTVLGLSVTQIRPLRSFVTFFRTQLKKTEEEMDETLKDYLTLCDGKHHRLEGECYNKKMLKTLSTR